MHEVNRLQTRVSEAEVCMGSDTPNYLGYVGILICISPLENLIGLPSHANCMQHVLRCSERQS